MKVRNIYQYQVDKPFKGENIDYKTNMTIPDQSMSIADILRRFATGAPLGDIVHGVHYDGGDEVDESYIDETLRPDYDLADATQALNEISENQRVIEAKKASKRAEKEQRDAEKRKEALKAEVLAELEEKKLKGEMAHYKQATEPIKAVEK